MKIKKFGTPLKPSAIKLMMLGSGELGKEVVIEAMRFGIEVIACDRYADAPAMLVANSAYVFDMRDGGALRHVVETVKPDFIVPEIEAIATDTLVELEKEGWTVVEEYTDHAISGSSMILRPGIQALISDSARGRFDMIMAEAMDRLSRDQEDIAGIFKRLHQRGF